MINEEPKRLEPTKDTVRELFALSGNLCAFPNCKDYLLNESGIFVGQICHIEGVKGERFNPGMTNEERRQSSNLVLMCYEHHKVTNDEGVWTVNRMRDLKAAHEARFRHPERAILAGLKDWTKVEKVMLPDNIRRLINTLDLPLKDDEEEQYFIALVEYLNRFKGVPVQYRAFLGRVVERMHHTESLGMKIVKNYANSMAIPAEDVRKAFNLSRNKVSDLARGLERYGLGDIDEGFEEHELRITNVGGIGFWYDLAEFCNLTDSDFEDFYENLNFSPIQQ